MAGKSKEKGNLSDLYGIHLSPTLILIDGSVLGVTPGYTKGQLKAVNGFLKDLAKYKKKRK